MSTTYKDRHHTLPFWINARQIAEKKTSEPTSATFRNPVYSYTMDAGLVNQLHYSFIHKMTVRYKIKYKTYTRNVTR